MTGESYETMETCREKSSRSFWSGEECEVELVGRGSRSEGTPSFQCGSKEQKEDQRIHQGWAGTSEKVLQGQDATSSDIRSLPEGRNSGDGTSRLQKTTELEWSRKTARIGFKFRRGT